jgi:hypothetical protein
MMMEKLEIKKVAGNKEDILAGLLLVQIRKTIK